MTATPVVSVLTAIAGLALAGYFYTVVKAADPGNERMVELMVAIQEGSRAFLQREYRWIAVFVGVMTVLIFAFLDYGRPWGAIAYLFGAGLSGLAGFIGMTVATMANARTTQAARTGPQLALPLAFRGGAVMGFSVAGLSLFGLGLSYIMFVQVLEVDQPFQVLTTFGLGASSIALFARIGGGIYTKAADMGADLVGKVEAGIPEDDPRNPATIADNVGDNVGDVAGMGADLFESYAGSIVAPIILSALLFGGFLGNGAISGEISEIPGGSLLEATYLFPLLVAGIGMIASIIGALLVRGREGKSLSSQLHFGTNLAMIITGLVSLVAGAIVFAGVPEFDNGWLLGAVIIIGLLAGYAIGFVSEYYTSDHYSPVKKLAGQSETGPATVIIAGIADGMLSTVASVILIVGALAASYGLGEAAFNIANGGLYAAALAAIGMLATTGAVVAVDAYGPISDNAGGIAEMAHLPPEVREVTDGLDSLGNTTAAVAKGFAIGSAALTALALFRSYTAAVGLEVIDLTSVAVISGLFLGSMSTFAFAALTLKSVGRAAQAMIVEVRRQFAEIPGLREGAVGVKPDSARCVDISTSASLREMVIPGSLAVILPLVVGFVSPEALGGLLAGALSTGFMLAIFMANAGGAWDNAKKYIEAGNLGGKGSDNHKAAVTGDTVGDPFKDTSGPAMNILIKVMTIVSLVFAPAFL
ncbi:MAG: sodium-translocating pyrophosphatase [Euzebya sp.]